MLSWAIEHVDRLDIDNYVFCSAPLTKDQLPSDHAQVMLRDPVLDGDNVLGEDIYKAFAKRVPADVYLLYHVTSPLMATKYYRTGINAVTRKGYDSAFSVAEVKTFCLFQGQPLNFRGGTRLPKTQDLEPVHQLTSGFFVFTHDVLFNMGCRIGKNPMAVVVDEEAAIDIDYKLDYDIARVLAGDVT